jgi:hypothetical protein
VVLIGGRVDSGGSLLTDIGWVETASLLKGVELKRVEEGRQPMPDSAHKSLVVLGSSWEVSLGPLVTGGD